MLSPSLSLSLSCSSFLLRLSLCRSKWPGNRPHGTLPNNRRKVSFRNLISRGLAPGRDDVSLMNGISSKGLHNLNATRAIDVFRTKFYESSAR